MKLLLLILVLAATFRLYGLNWDQNQHLQPDERMITMVSLGLNLPQTPTQWQNLLTPPSSLNPHFFAYGSFPLYLLKLSSTLLGFFNPIFSSYDGIVLVGRFLSVLFDSGTVIIIYLLGKKLLSERLGLLAAFFYTISVLPIQLAHFYAVDTPLTFFITLTLYRLLLFLERPNIKNALFIGLSFGFSLATKISSSLLMASIGAALAADFLLVFLKQPHKAYFWLPHLPKFLKRLAVEGGLIIVVTIVTFVSLEPFALIDFPSFLRQTQEQQRMTYDAFTFPYTLQYVNKPPYIYEIRNIFFWGLGPTLAVLAFAGTIVLTLGTLSKLSKLSLLGTQGDPSRSYNVILLSFFWVYFLVVGRFAIGFMRYMLPLYPLFCLFAASLVEQLKLPRLLKSLMLPTLILYSIFLILLLIWPLSFLHIYTQPNTRISATLWINQNIPQGTVLATEHWDDGLPIGTQPLYKMMELPMYESDLNPLKWDKVNQVLTNAEYIIIASNRLYVPLQKLTNCSTLPTDRCYTKTARYYQNLFGEHLGFKKVAEFSVLPTVPFLNLPINDFSADESFTVYDHPKVLIFKK